MPIVEFEGQKFNFPDDMSQGQMTDALKQYIDRQSQVQETLADQVNKADTLTGKFDLMLRAMLKVGREGRDKVAEELGEETVGQIDSLHEGFKKYTRTLYGDTLGDVVSGAFTGGIEDLNALMSDVDNDDPETSRAAAAGITILGALGIGAAIRQGGKIFKAFRGESPDDIAKREPDFKSDKDFEVGQVDDKGNFQDIAPERAPQQEFDEVLPDDGRYVTDDGDEIMIRDGQVFERQSKRRTVDPNEGFLPNTRPGEDVVMDPGVPGSTGVDVFRPSDRPIAEFAIRVPRTPDAPSNVTPAVQAQPRPSAETRMATAPGVSRSLEREGLIADFTDDDTIETFKKQTRGLPLEKKIKAKKNLEAIIKSVSEGIEQGD